MVQNISTADLKSMLDAQATCAVIDVREPGEYNTAHMPNSSLVPRRQLEFRMLRLVPYRGTPVILCDDDGKRAQLAAATLETMGYTQVSVLEGGLNRWTTEGHETEWGVNVPSKDFGERMSVEYQVPEFHPEELYERQQRGDKIVILDSRTPEEHRRSTIPGARSAPGGELALRISSLAPDPDTTIVVHCAGRTRSIIGARILQRMGYTNVYDLRNGTMGWRMADLDLEMGSQRLDLPEPTTEGLAEAEAFADRIAAEDGVQSLSVDALQALMARSDQENVYLIDVRTQEEYAAGHIPDFQWSPGGQVVQRSDDVAAVRNGHVVFACDGRVRATVTASWYRQMGFPNAYVLDGGVTAWRDHGLALEQSQQGGEGGYDEGLQSEQPFGYEAARQQVELISPQTLQERLDGTEAPVVLYVDTSRDFATGHIPGSHWQSRDWLEHRIADRVSSKSTAIVVTCANGFSSALAGATLKSLGYPNVAVLDGGLRAWQQAGHAVETGLSGIMSPPTDVLVMGIDRNWADAMLYLRWEEELGEKYEPKNK